MDTQNKKMLATALVGVGAGLGVAMAIAENIDPDMLPHILVGGMVALAVVGLVIYNPFGKQETPTV